MDTRGRRTWPIVVCALGLGCFPAAVLAQRGPVPATSQSPYVPITGRERLHEYFAGLANLTPFAGGAISAAIGQWRDVPHEWDQGAAGYGARFASSLAQHVVQQTILSGSAALLQEDPRFVPSGLTGVRRRLKYALAESVMARSREGRRQISWAKIGAIAGSAFLSRAWQPPSANQPHHAMGNLGAGFAVTAGLDVAHEFVPRLFRMRWVRMN